MPNISDIPEELMDLTKLADVKEFIAQLPMSYELRMSLFTEWSEEVNHKVSGADFAPFEDPEELHNEKTGSHAERDANQTNKSTSSLFDGQE